MSFDPALGSSRFPTRTSPPLDPERQVRDIVQLLIDSAKDLETASELVDNGVIARSLADMSHMRRRAADTVLTLAADAGVILREHVSGTLAGAIDRGVTRLSADDDAGVIEDVVASDDRLIVRLDAALGEDLPPAVKDQVRLIGAQVRDGLRSMAGWV